VIVELHPIRLLAAVALAPVAAVLVLNQYAKRSLSPPEESARQLPGDELITDEGAGGITRSIDIDAPPEAVWPLIDQIGQTKGGFYSFSIFERLVNFRIHNTYTPQERWQGTKVDDFMFFGQQGIGVEMKLVEPGKHLVGLSDSRVPPVATGAIGWLPRGLDFQAFTWSLYLEPTANGGTRFITRSRRALKPSDKGSWLGKLIVRMWGWSAGVMTTRMFDVVKKCAEGRRTGPVYAIADAYNHFWDSIWGTSASK
jgi:hypothetical protein